MVLAVFGLKTSTLIFQVYDRFPSFDLTPRKDFIKTTVKEVSNISFVIFAFIMPHRMKVSRVEVTLCYDSRS